MTFPFGRPVLVMLACGVAAGVAVLARPAAKRADLTVWTYDALHARAFAEPARRFERATGRTVRVDVVPPAAVDVRLSALFMAGPDAGGPDLAEIEIGSVGKFFRPPADAVGFLPLDGYLDRDRWRARISPARLAAYTKGGVVFGIPYDLHPCALAYRRDLFEQAGVDPTAARTWPQFQRVALAFQTYWAGHGRPRVTLGLSTASPDQVLLLLQQRHVDLVDDHDGVHLADPAVVATVCWYARACAGPGRIGTDFTPGVGQYARDLAGGDVCAAIAADWSVAELKQLAPDLAGTLAMMPLPRFDPADAATAGWGGTMIGIPRSCRRPDLAWRLIEALYLDPAALPARQRANDVLPPVPSQWADPAYHRADPFFAGQRVDELYLALAEQLPARHMTPYTAAAQAWVGIVVNRAVAYERDHAGDDGGLEAACGAWLAADAGRVASMARFDRAGAAQGGN